MIVHVESYTSAWAAEFEKVKVHLEEVLSHVAIVAIEHVGSTSVAGLAAKPVIDVDIIVKDEDMPSARIALVRAGYTDLGDLGIAGRYAFRQPGYTESDVADGLSHDLRRNTYVILDGCEALSNHLDVKRVLKRNASLRQKYSNVKLALAIEGRCNSIEEYVDGKSTVIREILGEAGWSIERMDALRPTIKK